MLYKIEYRMVKSDYRKGVMIMAQAMINFRMDEELKKSMYSERNMAYLKKVVEDIESGKSMN